jgi:uroporphyrinogen-III synthase
MAAEALAGRLVAVPETRELDVFAALLERRGAQVLRCPLVRIIDAPNPAPVLAWLRQFAAGGCDDLILLTGEGLRRLLQLADRQEPSLRPAVVAALGSVRRITRGPKPARALRELGLAPDIEALTPTTAGVIAALQPLDLSGRRVGVQLYGSEPNLPLIEFLRAAGSTPYCVAPSAYAASATDEAVTGLLQRMAAGEVDIIAFTSKAQIERLFQVGPAELVRQALAATAIAAVGPVVADTLLSHGVAVDAMPEASWFMKPLTTELVALCARTGNTAD